MFQFIVANDFHHAGEACTPVMQDLVVQMRSHAPIAFCLALGDFADVGEVSSIVAMREILGELDAPVYAVPGNHDCDEKGDTRQYEEVFPGQLNYHFDHDGWQFIGFDTTDGTNWQNSTIHENVLGFLRDTAARLDPERPTVLFTHFPLGEGVRFASPDAPKVYEAVDRLNVRCIFSGHYHGSTLKIHNGIELVTHVCCARVQDNLDGSTAKGYQLCTAHPDGRLERKFVEFRFPDN